MDFLASLHLDDLPEQQTRATHLSQQLAKDPNLRLGFNCCCTCGKQPQQSQQLLYCLNCQRVSYCSETCRQEDTRPPNLDEEEGAMGHSSVICSLLKLCNDDEDVLEDDHNNDNEGRIWNGASTASTTKRNTTTTMTAAARDAATDRVRSELESYPATMANILREAPCYQDFMSQFVGSNSSNGGVMNVHVIGASEDGELWSDHDRCLSSYTEAMLQLAEDFGISTIHLHMIGPDCPEGPLDQERTVPYERDGSQSFTLQLTTHKQLYTASLVQEIGKCHVAVFFNPGFTCPDYDWDETMSLLQYGTPFLSTTNTEMEGVSDCVYLMDCKLLPHMPPLAAEIMGMEGYGDLTFFAENPYAGSRVRQSGTMANDVFVKNRWMMGGILARPIKKRAMREKDEEEDISDNDDAEEVYPTRGNSKRTNPALI